MDGGYIKHKPEHIYTWLRDGRWHRDFVTDVDLARELP